MIARCRRFFLIGRRLSRKIVTPGHLLEADTSVKADVSEITVSQRLPLNNEAKCMPTKAVR